jgi:lambda family phage minor tail protein L
MTLEADLQQGWHDAIVEMFDLDLEPITGDVNDKFYFTNQLKPDSSKIQWKGNVYEPLPIISSGYEKNTTGQIAQPSLTVANVMGTFTQVIDSLDDLVGAKVTRRRTLGKYLDGEATADPTQEFPIDIFFVERKSAENALSITWQLASIFDLEGLMLPRRVITQNYCQWKYRSSECGYTGGAVAKADDSPTNNISEDVCGKRVSSCQLRFANVSLPFGGFPGAIQGRQ